MLFGGNELYKHVLQKKLKGWYCRTYFIILEGLETTTAILH